MQQIFLQKFKIISLCFSLQIKSFYFKKFYKIFKFLKGIVVKIPLKQNF